VPPMSPENRGRLWSRLAGAPMSVSQEPHKTSCSPPQAAQHDKHVAVTMDGSEDKQADCPGRLLARRGVQRSRRRASWLIPDPL
jgi:hypothetical protein